MRVCFRRIFTLANGTSHWANDRNCISHACSIFATPSEALKEATLMKKKVGSYDIW